MTHVTNLGPDSSFRRPFARFKGLLIAACVLVISADIAAQVPAEGQAQAGAQAATQSRIESAVLKAETGTTSPTLTLYRQLRSVGIDPHRVYHIRDGDFDREDIHISLTEGTVGFTQEVDGRVTGAFFEGEGELLLVPPNQTERASLALFAHVPVLEEKFATAYFRFNDSTYQELQSSVRAIPAEQMQGFVDRWNALAQNLADADALRLLVAADNSGSARIFHARVGGLRLGTFDVNLDTSFEDQIYAAQAGQSTDGRNYYDLWTAFPMRSARKDAQGPGEPPALFAISSFKIKTHVLPTHDLDVEATLRVRSHRDGLRALPFELSRFLQLKSVTLGSDSAGFIQNEALDGSQLARRGNDLFVVLLPRALRAGEEAELKFTYSGSVLSEAGGGLMYVGARGIWYPNQGPAMATFDLEFRYPSTWTLVASGHRTSLETVSNEQVSHWTLDRPVPLAGFNLGEYVSSSAHAGDVLVETYAARGLENRLQHALTTQQPTTHVNPRTGRVVVETSTVTPLFSPAEQVKPLTQRAAETINFISGRIGSFPFPSLALTQMPGSASQGWPGMVYLSSYAFLDPAVWDQPQMRISDFNRILYDKLMPAHEIAHQWWGDSVMWASYRDEWLMEALSNELALLELERASPDKFKVAMQYYRNVLLEKNRDGLEHKDAGAVTLGLRLASSKFPEAYDKVLYGRGTWLLHMLRMMLRESGETKTGGARGRDSGGGDELFFQVLRSLHEQHTASRLSTAEVQRAFEKALPKSLFYENRQSLDWFFSNWVNGTAIPKLEATDVRVVHKSSGSVVTGKLMQTETPEDFVTSVPIYGASATPAEPVFLGRVFADGRETEFRLEAPAGVTRVLVDPYETVLRRP